MTTVTLGRTAQALSPTRTEFAGGLAANVLTLLRSVFLALVVSIGPSELAVAEQDTPRESLSTINHPLAIAKRPEIVLSGSEASNIIALGSQILGQCRSTFTQQGPVADLSSIPSIITSSADMAAACGASMLEMTGGFEPLGTPRKVRVVNAINWCGGPGASIIGCAYTPGDCMVVRRFTSAQEGILWAHEFGHSKGLPHRSDSSDAVMYPSIGATHTAFNASECSSIRQLGLFNYFGPPMASSSRQAQLTIEEFVMQTHVHGVPYDTARLYSSAEVARVIPWLSDTARSAYWSNVASTVAIVADQRAYSVLQGFIFAAGSGALPLTEYDGRVAAIIGMGYVVRGNGSADARSFLERYSDPAQWSSVTWRAAYHANNDERNAHLAAAAVLGLSLVGDEFALQFLQRIDLTRFSSANLQILERAVRQAITDAEKFMRSASVRPKG